MAVKKLVCPGCGAPLTHKEGSNKVVCEYCGYVSLIEDEKKNDREHLENLAYAREKAKYAVEEERKKAERSRKLKGKLIAAAVVAVLVGISLLYNTFSKPACDPFEAITVEFSGNNGEGRAEIVTDSSRGIDTHLIDYELSAEDDLSEGDILTLTARSSGYRLTKSKMQIEVTGLDLYLAELDSLSDEMLELIHRKSSEICDRNLNGIVGLNDCNKIVSREPAVMYLATDGRNHNILHDITKLVVTNYEGEEKTVYIAAYYENITVRDGGNKSFNYDKCMYCGNQIWLGANTLRNGLIDGFDSLESAETHVRTTMDKDMQVIIREM